MCPGHWLTYSLPKATVIVQQGLSFSILQIKERRAIARQRDESLGESDPLGRSWAERGGRDRKGPEMSASDFSSHTKAVAFQCTLLASVHGRKGNKLVSVKGKRGTNG